MTGSYALIQKGIVINTIAWDGPDASPIDFPKGVTYVEFPDGDGVSPAIGWSYDGKTFTAPPLSDDEIAAQNQQKIDSNTELKSSLIAQATLTIAPLQDAVDLEMATDDEKAKLTAWKKYRVLLMRVDTSSASDIEWPDVP